MDFNWSLSDGVLGLVLLIVVVWVALKLVTRFVIGIVVVLIVAAVFSWTHWSDFGFGG